MKEDLQQISIVIGGISLLVLFVVLLSSGFIFLDKGQYLYGALCLFPLMIVAYGSNGDA